MDRFSTPIMKQDSLSRLPVSNRTIIEKLENLSEVELVRLDFLEQDPEVRKCIDFVFAVRRMNKAIKQVVQDCCKLS